MEDIVLSEDDVSGEVLRKQPEDCTVLELKRWLKLSSAIMDLNDSVGRKQESLAKKWNIFFSS